MPRPAGSSTRTSVPPPGRRRTTMQVPPISWVTARMDRVPTPVPAEPLPRARLDAPTVVAHGDQKVVGVGAGP